MTPNVNAGIRIYKLRQATLNIDMFSVAGASFWVYINSVFFLNNECFLWKYFVYVNLSHYTIMLEYQQ